jgi:outer membrane protein assembly factor BamD (BamD/ComL family)
LRLRNRNLRLDYAYIPHHVLGDTHQFSFGFNFGRSETEKVISREEREAEVASLYEEGMAYFNQKQYIQAIAKFSEILRLDPGNKEALNKMKEANRLLMEKKQLSG